MGYENAIQTKMLATRCAVCARPLVDSVSITAGMGPDCREKHGYNIEVTQAARKAANEMVYQIAVNRELPELCMEYCNSLRGLGFTALAGVILSRIAAVVIEERSSLYYVQTEYDERLVPLMRTVPGRRWDKVSKTNTFPVSSKKTLFDFLVRYYPGKIGFGSKGGFVIGAKASKPSPQLAPEPRQLDFEDTRAQSICGCC